MITPAYGLTATERVLPKLALDFTTASLDPRVTFTRTGNTATVVNSSGYVATINANLPRFDYNPITLACNGLLIEESRANTILYSEDLTNAAWTKIGSTISSDAIISPSENLNADKMIENTSTGNHSISQFVPVSGTAYSISFFAKAAERTKISFSGGGFGAQGFSAIFDLNNGTMFDNVGNKGTITAYKNGWYRCNVSFTPSSTVATAFNMVNNAGNSSYTGDGISGLYVWGVQTEIGAFPTSYIPTTTAAVTRNADVATMTGTNFSSWYTATTGAASVWVIPQTATGTRPVIQFDDTTANEIIALRGNVANPELYIVDGGTPQAQIDAGTIVANTAYKLTGTWNTDSCAAAQNGAAVVTDNTATIPALTQLRIGSNGTNYVCAWVQKVMYWPQRLINAEVQSFSK